MCVCVQGEWRGGRWGGESSGDLRWTKEIRQDELGGVIGGGPGEGPQEGEEEVLSPLLLPLRSEPIWGPGASFTW